jgi:hypothetical protein
VCGEPEAENSSAVVTAIRGVHHEREHEDEAPRVADRR